MAINRMGTKVSLQKQPLLCYRTGCHTPEYMQYLLDGKVKFVVTIDEERTIAIDKKIIQFTLCLADTLERAEAL